MQLVTSMIVKLDEMIHRHGIIYGHKKITE